MPIAPNRPVTPPAYHKPLPHPRPYLHDRLSRLDHHLRLFAPSARIDHVRICHPVERKILLVSLGAQRHGRPTLDRVHRVGKVVVPLGVDAEVEVAEPTRGAEMADAAC
eukprot:scaffold6877_cov119-Isochrysis_galbana.AAC.2